jgi:hypothetical protein
MMAVLAFFPLHLGEVNADGSFDEVGAVPKLRSILIDGFQKVF